MPLSGETEKVPRRANKHSCTCADARKISLHGVCPLICLGSLPCPSLLYTQHAEYFEIYFVPRLLVTAGTMTQRCEDFAPRLDHIWCKREIGNYKAKVTLSGHW
jgi:hypothetical protein